MVKKFFQRCRGLLCAPFVRWWAKRSATATQPGVATAYEALSGWPLEDKGSAMQRRLRGTALDTLTARVGPGHLAVVPLLMAMAYDEPSPPRRRVYQRRALTLARGHYGYSHPLTLFIEDQQDQRKR